MRKQISFSIQTVLDQHINNGKYIIDNLPVFINPRFHRVIMATKITCDVCKKDFAEDQTYEVKAKSRNTTATLIVDVCHECFVKPESLFSNIPRAWKKWKQGTGWTPAE